MMAVGHALSGLCAGLSVGALLNGPVSVAFSVAGAKAGAAVVPDIDHPGSTVTTSLGTVSEAAHRGVVRLNQWVFKLHGLTPPKGAHRKVTHWWPFPIVCGLITGIATALSPWATWVLLSLLFMLAFRALSVPEYRANDRGGQWAQMRRKAAHGAISVVPTIWLLRRLRRLLRHRRVLRAGQVVFGGLILGACYLVHETVGRFFPWWVEALLYLIGFCVSTVLLVRGGSQMLTRLGVLGVAAVLAAFAVWGGGSAELGGWWGLVVWAGMQLHIEGDRPTESGIPGLLLSRTKRWPKALAFKAGGAFEMLAMWLPMSIYAGTLITYIL